MGNVRGANLMQSKNKPAQTAAERRHVAKVAELPCSVCDDTGPVEVHEPEQGCGLQASPFACHATEARTAGTEPGCVGSCAR
jgi:RecJ-like exonuclease